MKLSVLITTYNHEEYIGRAIEGVLMQEVDFDYEIVVGEDCSTDNTRGILLEYRNKYPDRIRLLLHDHNIGPNENFLRTLKQCGGEFIALLDGDDYWTSSHKLKRQMYLLASDAAMSMCFHNVVLEEQGEFHKSFYPGNLSRTPALQDYILYAMLSSVVFRNIFQGKSPEELLDVTCGDVILYYLLNKAGKTGYMDEEMAVYRVHSRGIWNSLTGKEQLKAHVDSFVRLRSICDKNDAPLFDGLIDDYLFNIAICCLNEGDREGAGLYYRRLLSRFKLNRHYMKSLLSLTIRRLSPGVHSVIRRAYRPDERDTKKNTL